MAPDTRYELALLAEGHQLIAGLDEAGRGCWAGPVVAAAVIFPPHILRQPPPELAEVDDSKQLNAAERAGLVHAIEQHALAIGVGVVPAFVIDGHGILPATRCAMLSALWSLRPSPQTLLIDAVKLPEAQLPFQALIGGDGLVLSIAAASIIAKTSRDRLMQQAARAYPDYGFEQHKGYGTAAHQNALKRLGPCPIHRMTFKPLLAFHAAEPQPM